MKWCQRHWCAIPPKKIKYCQSIKCPNLVEMPAVWVKKQGEGVGETPSQKGKGHR